MGEIIAHIAEASTDAAHRGIVRLIERFRRAHGPAVAEAVAVGTANGLAEWLVLTLGARRAYEIFQRAADTIIAANAASTGAVNVEQATNQREGKRK